MTITSLATSLQLHYVSEVNEVVVKTLFFSLNICVIKLYV